MSQREAANHWSSDKVIKRQIEAQKKRKEENNTTPYMASYRYGEDEKRQIEAIRRYLQKLNFYDTNWNKDSMLMRKIINLAFAFVSKMESEQEEIEKSGVV